MRAPLALGLALALALPGCLDGEALQGRLEEARLERDEAQAQATNASVEARAWRDAARAQENLTREALAQGEGFSQRASAADEARAQAEALAAARENELLAARLQLDAAAANVSRLEERLALDASAESLARVLEAAKAELARTQQRYDDALAGKFETLTTVERGNVTWQFTDLRGDTRQWRYAIEDYRQDVKRIRPTDALYLSTKGGRTLRVADPRPYLDAAPFEDKVEQLTDGRSDREFVREVFHLKTQLVDYSFSLIDEKGYYKYPGETLVEGSGVCGDTTILLASLLAAGEAKADHGLEVALWIVKWDAGIGGFVQDPETVDHAVLEVRFRDGTVWYVETTSFAFVTHPQVHGWRYDWA